MFLAQLIRLLSAVRCFDALLSSLVKSFFFLFLPRVSGKGAPRMPTSGIDRESVYFGLDV